MFCCLRFCSTVATPLLQYFKSNPGSRDSLARSQVSSAHDWIWAMWENIHNSLLARCPIGYLFSATKHKTIHHHHHQPLNREGRWGTTDDFATSFLHFSLFSTALWDLPNSRPVQSLMLSSHLFLCLPCLLPPFTVPCKMVLARPAEWETWPYHCRLLLFTIVRSSLCGPIACWILAWTSSLLTWSLYDHQFHKSPFPAFLRLRPKTLLLHIKRQNKIWKISPKDSGKKKIIL